MLDNIRLAAPGYSDMKYPKIDPTVVRDGVGRRLKVGDRVAYYCGIHNAFQTFYVRGFTPKKVKVQNAASGYNTLRLPSKLVVLPEYLNWGEIAER